MRAIARTDARAALLAACALLCQAAFAQSRPPFESLAKMFEYDRTAPLGVKTDERETAEGAVVVSISYAGARGPVSASLVTPLGSGKHPALIFVHDSGHRRDEFLAEAILLATSQPAAVSLLIDAPSARPVGWRRAFNPMIEDNDRDVHVQAVIDIRRGIDLLAARTDVDAGKIAYVGHGYGANWGAILSSIEPRLQAFVLIAGIPSLTEVMSGDDPEWADMRFAMGSDRFARYLSSLSAVDAIGYIGHAAAGRLFFQFGRFDPFVPRKTAERLVQAAGRPARASFYDAGHEANDPRALVDRSRFLAERIGSGPVRFPAAAAGRGR